MVEWNTCIPLGNSTIRIKFINGSVSSRGIDPALFVTSNRVIQAAIESCPFYGTKIKLVHEYKEANDKVKKEKNVYPDIKNMLAAKELLRSDFGVELSELQNKEAIIAKAVELGIKFCDQLRQHEGSGDCYIKSQRVRLLPNLIKYLGTPPRIFLGTRLS